jgi:hypothetical protein
MTTIKINEFTGYDIDEFIEFVNTETSGEFIIHIPKETTLFYCSCEDISQEYAIAAYIGQKLHEISSKFEYHAADLNSLGEFTFIILTNNFKTLGELISEISSVFGNSETIEPINFTSEVSSFIKEFRNKKAACQDLFDLAIEYHTS